MKAAVVRKPGEQFVSEAFDRIGRVLVRIDVEFRLAVKGQKSNAESEDRSTLDL